MQGLSDDPAFFAATVLAIWAATVAGAGAVAAGADALAEFLAAGSRHTESGSPDEGVSPAADSITEWLGPGPRLITNQSGDIVVISKHGTRKVRFDLNNTNPHEVPHGHVEELIDGEWVGSGPIYPKDLPHR